MSGEENSHEIAMNVILPGLEVDLDMILIHDTVSTDFNHTLGAWVEVEEKSIAL